MSWYNTQTLILDFFYLKGLYKTFMGYWDNLNMNWKLHDILFSFLAVIMIVVKK